MQKIYIFNRSYSGKLQRERLARHLARYPQRILTGTKIFLTLFIFWIFITLYLIATN